ncbi:CheR family methyltransferase [Coraliomargarita sinensis]|nr:CheR family methyltransferase [Coraliomargarita sinensis]
MNQRLTLIGVGASAGGLDALTDFFKGVPSNCEAAFLVIQHLSPDHESSMDELLAPHAKLPLVEAIDGMQLDGGAIYLCPPGVIPRVNGLALSLEARPRDKSVVLPINVLFESMARTLGGAAAAVVLSGTGSDGSEGICSIEQSGGIVAVQSPETAEFTGMPQSAISTGRPHLIAKARDLWTEVSRYAEGGASASTVPPARLTSDDQPTPFDAADYADVFNYLENRFGLNFSYYRINSVSRRLNRRMDLLSVPDIQEYLKYLKSNDNEADCLYKDLLIGVTEFFRDSESFATLSLEAIKHAMKAEPERELRIWSAGCATGQEAYSLFILADEARREVGFVGRVTVFATDVFKPSVDFAAKGLYSRSQLGGLSHEQLEHYFQIFDSGHYKIRSFVRENIVFAEHNFLTDPPFTNMDVVSCRNVLIYLNPETQEAALSAFVYSLRDNGYLFLGGSESLGKFEGSFKPVSNKAKVFQKYGSQLDANRWPKNKVPAVRKVRQPLTNTIGASVTINRDLLGAYDSLLERFAPCGFLINSDQEVLHYFGDASDFCVNVAGRATLGLLEQLDKDLKLSVSALLNLVQKRKRRAASRSIRCRDRLGSCVVDIAIEPLRDQKGEVRNFLIEIQRNQDEQVEEGAARETSADAGLESLPPNAEQQIKLLEDELKATRENLEAANEELQVSNEELQAVNEELHVSNEELQSTNEELHSLNEELTTLNAEYQRKNQELVEVNTSHENLLQSTEDGVLYVDREMRIRQFNRAIKTAFSLVPADVGRPLRDIAYQMEDAHPLLEDVKSVLEAGKRVERETDYINGRLYLKRMYPFRAEGGAVDGVLLTFTDVTELRRLEKRFEFALESAKLSWWDWNLKTGQVSVTSGGKCILGNDCLRQPRDREGWMKLVHPDDRDLVTQALDDCLEGRTKEWSCEHRFGTDASGWLWVHNQGIVTQWDRGGRVVEMMGTTANVDSYKRALMEARNQQAILEATDEISKVGAWDYNPETEEVIWSQEIRKILEVGDDFVPSAEKTYNMVRPADRELLVGAFERITRDGTPYDLQLHFKSAKGRELLCRSAGRARFDDNGRIVRVVGIFQDITELTMIEEELEAFFDLSPDFQATLAMDGTFKIWNPPWETKLGYSPGELSSMHLSEMVVDADREAFIKVLESAVRGSLITSYETRVRIKGDSVCVNDAKEAWMSWSFSSAPDLSLIFVSARCVTEQKEAQQALQEARVRAEEANRAKSDFLAVMSHELRTPLNPILGFTDMLIEEAETDEQKEILQTIVSSGTHMLSLINEILDYSKIDAGKSTLDPVEFSLEDFVAQKVSLMSGQIKDESIELTHSIDWGPVDASRVPSFIGDISMLRQICRNLVSNAIKFTPKGKVNLNVAVQRLEGELAYVRFDVSDTGIGIAKSDLSKLFKPFTQVQSGTTREYGGTGLGLAICKRLVDLMDGSISVESEEGVGSTFTFTLPLVLRYNKDPVADAKKKTSSTSNTNDKKFKGSILLVEDNESNAFYIKALVGARGADVELATQGEAALEELRERSFDLVLLDLHMPGIGGLETLKRIRSSERSRTRNLPVWVLTADASTKAKQDSHEYGADGLLVKPVTPTDVYEVLGKYLEEV